MSNTVIKQRLSYIDIAKGLLICCLLYGHMIIFARMEGLDDSIMGFIQKSVKLYSGFFMQTFFFITGYCSSFNRIFKVFLWNNIKTILIPSILLTIISGYGLELMLDKSIDEKPILNLYNWLITGGPWFVITLFWAKMVYWFINRLSLKRQFYVLAIVYLLGIVLNVVDIIPNYWFHRHVMLMLPYLFLGSYCKNHQDEMNKWLCPLALFGLVSISCQFAFSQIVNFYSIPQHDLNIGINKSFLIHIINVVSGTALVLYVSKKIGNNNFLETLGRGSLLAYLWNGLINRPIIIILPSPDSDSIVKCAIYYLFVYVIMLVVMYLLIKLIYDTKYLQWMVGKW